MASGISGFDSSRIADVSRTERKENASSAVRLKQKECNETAQVKEELASLADSLKMQENRVMELYNSREQNSQPILRQAQAPVFTESRLNNVVSQKAKGKLSQIKSCAGKMLAHIALQFQNLKQDSYSKISDLVINNQGAQKHVGALGKNMTLPDLLKMSDQMSIMEKKLIDAMNNLSPAEKTNAMNRLSEMKEMAKYAKILKNDHFKDDVIMQLVDYRLQLKATGLTEGFPQSLGGSGGALGEKDTWNTSGVLKDENGVEFDNLRANKDDRGKTKPNDTSATSKFSNFCQERGGNYSVIENYYNDQKISSWKTKSLEVKELILDFREVKEKKFFFATSVTSSDKATPDYQTRRNTVLMFMAFNMELLTTTDLPGKNNDKGTITIYRTENKAGIEANNIKKPGKGYEIKRGPAESGSIMAPIAATGVGTHVTVQEVPLHRIIGSYLTQPLLNDDEKEFICMFDGIPTEYLGELET